MDYRKVNKIKFTTWSNEQELHQWNQNTKEFEKVVVDCQEEINKYNGQDLKSFMLRNGVIPIVTDKQPAYINETDFKDIHLSNVYDSLNTDIVENGNYMEKMAAAQEVNNKVVEQESQNTNIADNNIINVKIDKKTGEVIK